MSGFCKNTLEFVPVYAGMTMEANEAIPPTNDRWCSGKLPSPPQLSLH